MRPISPNELVSSILLEVDLNGIVISDTEVQLRNKLREIKYWQRAGAQTLFLQNTNDYLCQYLQLDTHLQIVESSYPYLMKYTTQDENNNNQSYSFVCLKFWCQQKHLSSTRCVCVSMSSNGGFFEVIWNHHFGWRLKFLQLKNTPYLP